MSPKGQKAGGGSPKKTAKRSKGSLDQKLKSAERSTLRHFKRFMSSRLERLALVKRVVLGWVILVAVLIGVSIAQWVNTRASFTTVAKVDGGTYIEGVLGRLDSLNPIFAKTSAERSVARLMFASLYSYDSTGRIKGDLAQSVEINSEETEYIVTLLPDITWSDGSPLTSADVEFTVGLLRNDETKSEISGWQAFKAEAIGARTVKFTLPTPYAPFMHALSFPILPKHILGEVSPAELREHSFSSSPITSGPFAFRLLQDVSADGSKKVVHMIANDRYRHGKPKLERFQLNVYPNKEDIVSALKAHEISGTPELIYSELSEPMKQSYKSSSNSINDGVYALFNTTSETLQSQSVRKALYLSIDRQKLRDKLARSTQALDGPIAQSQVDIALPVGEEHDLEKAKALLADDGWILADGMLKKDSQQMSIRLVTLKNTDFSQVVDELSQTWRRDLGIKVDVQIVDPKDPAQNVLQTVLQPRNYDVLVYEFVLGGDPDSYIYWHSSQATDQGKNFSNYKNTLADEALSSGRGKRNPKQRFDRYNIFVKRWLSDVPAIPLYQPNIDYVHTVASAAITDGSKLVYLEDRYSSVLYWSVKEATVYKTP